MRRRTLLCFLCSSIASIASLGQDLAPPSPQRLVVHSNVLNEDRVIWVRMPAASRGKKESYPVLYMTDGGTNVNEIGSIIDFLADNNFIPPLIVVGITNTDRNRDLTPSQKTFRRHRRTGAHEWWCREIPRLHPDGVDPGDREALRDAPVSGFSRALTRWLVCYPRPDRSSRPLQCLHCFKPESLVGRRPHRARGPGIPRQAKRIQENAVLLAGGRARPDERGI